MTRCDHTLGNDGGLVCTRDTHDDRGHTYEASSPGDNENGYDE